MEKGLQEQWLKFMGGHWTKEKPTKEGDYAITDRDSYKMCRGKPLSYRTVGVYNYDGKLRMTVGWADEKNPMPWGGWWWSEPMPKLPNPGEW